LPASSLVRIGSTITKRPGSSRHIIKITPVKKHDAVNNPSHYTDGKIEVIEFIEDKNMDFHLGNAVKYIARAGKKDPSKLIEDLEKAQWYLNRKINNLKKSK